MHKHNHIKIVQKGNISMLKTIEMKTHKNNTYDTTLTAKY